MMGGLRIIIVVIIDIDIIILMTTCGVLYGFQTLFKFHYSKPTMMS